MWGRPGVSVAEIEELYRLRGDQLVRVAATMAGNGEAGRDAVQDAFATAIRKRSSFRGTGPLEAWLWRIVVNAARRYAGERRHAELDQVGEASSNGHAAGGLDELGIRFWIAALPERQREVLFLRHFADMDYRQIAEILEIEVGTVSATLSAAHNKLRVALREVQR